MSFVSSHHEILQLNHWPCLYVLQYISLLRTCKLKERLRAARQRMHDLFPFNEQQWLAWIDDELDNIKDTADIERVKALYTKAVQDYLSVPIWVSYLR